jgi:hypothetical protein
MTERDELPSDFVARRNVGVAEVSIDDEIVLYHEELETVHVLNPSASLVWAALDGAVSIEKIASAFAERFEVERAVILADVTSIIGGFGRHGLLHHIPPDPDVVAAAKPSSAPPKSDREPPEAETDTEKPRATSSPRYRSVPPDR